MKEKAFAALQLAKDHALKYKQQIESVKEMASKQKAIVEKQLLQQLQEKEKRIADLQIALQDALANATAAATEAASIPPSNAVVPATDSSAVTSGSSSEALLAAQADVQRLTAENASLQKQLAAASLGGDSVTEELRQQLAEAQDRLKENTLKFKGLQTELAALREKDTINSSVAEQQAKLAADAQAEVEQLKVR